MGFSVGNNVFPYGSDTYQPSVNYNLVVEFSRSPDSMDINKVADYRLVPQQKGLWVQMLNDGQGRVENATDALWADGNDSPGTMDGNDQFAFAQYSCDRYRYSKKVGNLSLEQAGWDLKNQTQRFLAQQLATARSFRLCTTLTTSGNYKGNTGASSSISGGGGTTWANSSGTTNSIRKSVTAAAIQIYKNTYSSVRQDQLQVVVNPDNAATVVALGTEYQSFISQQADSPAIWANDKQYSLWGLPLFIMGMRWTVVADVYNTALPGQTPSYGFCFPDSYAAIVTQPMAIKPAGGSAFSSLLVPVYEDISLEEYVEPKHRRTMFHATENIDTNLLYSPQTSFLLSTNS